MNRILRLFSSFFFFGIVLMSSGCQPEGIIPRDDMVALFSEFYKADACIDAANASFGRTGGMDSLRVYQPVIEQYGYTKEMFRSSVEYYLHRPDELNKIFNKVNVRLKKEAEKTSDGEEDDGKIREEQEDELEEPGEDELEVKEQKDKVIDIREGVEPEIEKEDVLKEEKPEPVLEKKDRNKPVRKRLTKKDMKRLEEAMK